MIQYIAYLLIMYIKMYQIISHAHHLLFFFVALGAEPTEATATVKYNRNRKVFTTNVQIPDYDVEAGIRVGITDIRDKGKSITLEISNKNIIQLGLIGRAK